MKILNISILIILFTNSVFSQVGGTSTYNFLNLTNSARVASMGGKFISVIDNDLNLAFQNPALLNPSMDKHLTLNYINYFIDINYGYTSFAKHYEKIGTFAAGIHYINYGTFIKADEKGNRIGEFKASEYALNLYWARKIDSSFRFGINLKPILSTLEKYTSFGLLADIGLVYTNKQNKFSAAIVIKNAGVQIKTYTDNNREPVPFDIQLGISKQLKHAPFRFSVLLHHLYKWDMTYDMANNMAFTSVDSDIEEQQSPAIGKFADNILRHAIISTEILFTKNFALRFGYNYQRKKELQIQSRKGLAGFSAGFGFKVYKFHFSYGIAKYHLAGSSNHFSISTRISDF